MVKFSDLVTIGKEKTDASEIMVKRNFKIQKSDDDKMLAFGWASVAVTADGEQIDDYQHDIIDPDELEKAAYNFVQLYRDGGEMHNGQGPVATLVESVVFTEEKQAAMGIPDGTLPVGWWIGFKVLDSAVWDKVKDGTYSMFSIQGEAVREDVDQG